VARIKCQQPTIEEALLPQARKPSRRRRDIYQEVTDKIVGYLEDGIAPWRNPINRGSGDGWPKNLGSGKRYRGINIILLGMRAWESGYSSDYWLTYKQAAQRGGTVRQGEQGSLVTFWKLYEKKDPATNTETTLPVLKHYHAFNLEQIDGIPIPDAPDEKDLISFTPLEKAEEIVAGYLNGPNIETKGSRAFYRPAIDTVCLPLPQQFESSEIFYSTLFHELSHSTGHSKRLDRGLDTEPQPFGSPDYSREELVAELSASFLCAASGISPPTIEQSAAYMQGWINVLKGDKRLVVSAAGAAQKSADLILGEGIHEQAEKPAENQAKLGHSTQDHAAKPSQLDLF
jgi:antirestriction protein ArdC